MATYSRGWFPNGFPQTLQDLIIQNNGQINNKNWCVFLDLPDGNLVILLEAVKS